VTDLHYKMVTPEMEAGKQYPVFYYHYSGPGPQIVTRGWDGALQQAVVDAGYIWLPIAASPLNSRSTARWAE